jgi:hypothetical protein
MRHAEHLLRLFLEKKGGPGVPTFLWQPENLGLGRLLKCFRERRKQLEEKC